MSDWNDLTVGDDGLARCHWAASAPDYIAYHDDEWGRATTDERTLFEKLCLEGFQSGLSWLTILRKRERFRERFANFEAAELAEFDEPEIADLLTDAGIIRHRGKIEASINNARVLRAMWDDGRSLGALIWSHEPPERPAPTALAEVPASEEHSTALAKALKKEGFRFVGPTTVYAGMQAMGVVNDHLADCHSRALCDRLRSETERPG